MNTTLGGIYSIGLRCIYFFTIYYFIFRMINREDNNYATIDFNVDW